jgi:hypothetical protein
VKLWEKEKRGKELITSYLGCSPFCFVFVLCFFSFYFYFFNRIFQEEIAYSFYDDRLNTFGIENVSEKGLVVLLKVTPQREAIPSPPTPSPLGYYRQQQPSKKRKLNNESKKEEEIQRVAFPPVFFETGISYGYRDCEIKSQKYLHAEETQISILVFNLHPNTHKLF